MALKYIAAIFGGIWLLLAGYAAQAQSVSPVTPYPSNSPSAALSSVQTTVAATNIIAKAAPGNLYGITITSTGVPGRLVVYDAVSLPADGARTPIRCYPVPASTAIAISFGDFPLGFRTGITVGFSTGADCYTQAAASAEFIAVLYK